MAVHTGRGSPVRTAQTYQPPRAGGRPEPAGALGTGCEHNSPSPGCSRPTESALRAFPVWPDIPEAPAWLPCALAPAPLAPDRGHWLPASQRAFPGCSTQRRGRPVGDEVTTRPQRPVTGLETFIDSCGEPALPAAPGAHPLPPCPEPGCPPARGRGSGGRGQPRTRTRTSSCGPPCRTSPRCSSSSRPRPAGPAPGGGRRRLSLGFPAGKGLGAGTGRGTGDRGRLPSRCPPS